MTKFLGANLLKDCGSGEYDAQKSKTLMKDKEKPPIRIQIRFVRIEDLRKSKNIRNNFVSKASERLVQDAKHDVAARRYNITFDIKRDANIGLSGYSRNAHNNSDTHHSRLEAQRTESDSIMLGQIALIVRRYCRTPETTTLEAVQAMDARVKKLNARIRNLQKIDRW